MTTMAERARAASFPTQLRSPAYEEKLKDEEGRKAEERLRADERAADAATGDPGTPGPPPPGWKPVGLTAKEILEKQANQQTTILPQPTTNAEVQADVRREHPVPELETSGAGRLVGMTPGGWLPAQRSREQSVTGPQFSPETSGLLNQAALMEAGALRAQAAVEGGRNLALQGVEEQRAKQEAIYAEGRVKRDEFHQRVVKARRDKIAALEADVADDKVDPRRLFKNKNAGELALFGLGGILASIGAGFSAAAGQHGPSPFIEQMRINVQQDIAAQEHDIAKKERGIGRAVNALDALQQTFGDRETAVLAMENLQLKAYENATKKLMLKYDNTALAPKLQLANAQIVRMLGENRMKMEAMSQYKSEARQADAFNAPKPIYAGGGKPKTKYGWAEYKDMDPASRAAVEATQDRLLKEKIPDREDKLRDLLAGMGGVDANTVSQLAATGEPGAVRRYLSQKLAGNPKAQARLARFKAKDWSDLFGANVSEREANTLSQSYGEEYDPERLIGLVESVQGSINSSKAAIKAGGPAGAWVLDNYEAQRRRPMPGQLAPTGEKGH